MGSPRKAPENVGGASSIWGEGEGGAVVFSFWARTRTGNTRFWLLAREFLRSRIPPQLHAGHAVRARGEFVATTRHQNRNKKLDAVHGGDRKCARDYGASDRAIEYSYPPMGESQGTKNVL